MREMSEERDIIRGKLKQVVFRNDDNGYTVARFIDGAQRAVYRSSPLRHAVSG